MCFSAKVSFLTSALLSIIGIATLKNVKSKNQLLFGSIPLLFALQQFAEGLLWIFYGQNILTYILAYIFLFFAFIFWPIWIPISILLMEKDNFRKKLLYITSSLGIIYSIFSIIYITINKVNVEISCSHVTYWILNFPKNLQYIALILYLLTTVMSCFISSVKYLNYLGLIILLSCISSCILWYNSFISIWCFFVAIISSTIYFIIKAITRKEK